MNSCFLFTEFNGFTSYTHFLYIVHLYVLPNDAVPFETAYLLELFQTEFK